MFAVKICCFLLFALTNTVQSAICLQYFKNVCQVVLRIRDGRNFPLVEEADVDMSLQHSSPQNAMTNVIIEPGDGWVPEKFSGTLWKGSQFRKVSTLLCLCSCIL